MIELLIALLIFSNIVWFISFTSYQYGVNKALDEHMKSEHKGE